MARRDADPLDDLIRQILGKRARELSAREFRMARRAYREAGAHALRSGWGTPKQASEAIATARAQLGRARSRLAAITTPDHPEVFVDRGWRNVAAASREQRARLHRHYGVVGIGIGFRHKDGAQTDEPAIVVAVRRKHGLRTLERRGHRPLPRSVKGPGGERIRVDVIDFGRIRREVQGGDSVGPTGRKILGTIGALGRDLQTGATVALTALHVAEPGSSPPNVDMSSPSAVVSSQPLHLGRVMAGTMHEIDAAKVSVDPPRTGEFSINGIGPVRGWRPITVPGDIGAQVRMYGAKTGLSVGRIDYIGMDVPEDDLRSLIVVKLVAAQGDSGAALVDNDGHVLGLLVGESTRVPGSHVFSPIGMVLQRLGCDIPFTQ